MDPKTYLQKILDKKQDEIAQLSQSAMVAQPLEAAVLQVDDASLPYRGAFFKALKQDRLQLIAEVKKASPSKGVIRADFQPVALAREFEANGAAALSVLTEKHYFLGDPAYLSAIKSKVRLPILRKDFIIDPVQVIEAQQMGADAILLIKAILTQDQFVFLHRLANSVGLDVLVEVHTESELADVLQLETISIVGVNNRDLSSFRTDIQTAPRIKDAIDPSRRSELVVIAESGYSSAEELKTLQSQQFNAVLIGEGLSTNPALLQGFAS